jgi:hypothetical protein
MPVYVSAPELPLVLACTDADVDLVVAEIGHWADAGLTNVFRPPGDVSYVVNFGRITALTVGSELPGRERDKTVFPIEIGARVVGAAGHDDHHHAHDH